MEPIGLSITDTGFVLGGTEKPLSRATIYRKVKAGELEARRIGGRTLITVESIKRLVAEAPTLARAA